MNAFPDSYASSRARFCQLATGRARWLRSISLPAVADTDTNRPVPIMPAPAVADEDLTVDVAYWGPVEPQRLVLVTSGLHGVEGFFGAAIQHRLLEELAPSDVQPVGLLLVHALNPWGFAYRRRWNETNVDLNRNFLLPGEAFAGSPPRYADLNRLLNPPHAPRAADPFLWLAAGKLARFGLASLQQAIAGGQYDFPQGLFFGGHQPAATQILLREHLQDWLQGATEVLHLDFHTGLGPSSTYKLLVDEPATAPSTRYLHAIFGQHNVCSPSDSNLAHRARGGLGTWCQHFLADRKYVYACAEFGTYRPLKVLAGLRKENQTYWHTPAGSDARNAASKRLQELFCPASRQWRDRTLADGVQLVRLALAFNQT